MTESHEVFGELAVDFDGHSFQTLIWWHKIYFLYDESVGGKSEICKNTFGECCVCVCV
jgi:hypothetical protein